MNVLIMGKSSETDALCGCLAGCSDLSVTHCPDRDRAIDEMRTSPHAYEWIFIDNDVAYEDRLKVVDEIEGLGIAAPVSVLNHSPDTSCEDESSCSGGCAIEKTSDGLQVLRCAFRNARWEHSEGMPLARQPWSFEYHAECKAPLDKPQ